ncbi:MAG: hypothetical protein JWQ43_499 [Glaciihabitans sp.]|nr:hypothetical protein [Glaciihabitans sp.]
MTLGVYIGAFLVGTTTHIIDLAVLGRDVYGTAPAAFQVFFVALTLLDPLIAILLSRLHRSGLALAVAVMVIDVTANLLMTGIDPAWPWPFTQSLFGILVLITVTPLWLSLAPRGVRDPVAQ